MVLGNTLVGMRSLLEANSGPGKQHVKAAIHNESHTKLHRTGTKRQTYPRVCTAAQSAAEELTCACQGMPIWWKDQVTHYMLLCDLSHTKIDAKLLAGVNSPLHNT